MNVTEIAHLLQTEIAETDLLTWLAVVFSVAEVLYACAGKIWLYPTGIVATSLCAYVLFCGGLYAEALLNLYYFVMSIYGWCYWIKKKNKPAVKIATCSIKEHWIAATLAVVSCIFVWQLLKQCTPSTVPFWDALVSACAWAGMWLLAKRKIENWLWLNVSNAIAIPVLWYKHLLLFSLLTIFIFIVGVQGYYKWKKQQI